MADSVHVFESAVRQKNSEFHIVFRLLPDGSVNYSLPSVSILWMKALSAFIPTRHTLMWIEAVDAIPFIGQMQSVPTRYLPNPASGMREPLGFLKVHLALLQGFIESTQSRRGIVKDLAELGEFIVTHNPDLMPKLATG